MASSKLEELNCIVDSLETIQTESEISESLTKLDEIIKSDQEIREKLLDDRFYSVLFDHIRRSYASRDWPILCLIVRCLKNSAAAFKSNFNEHEKSICLFIGQILKENVANESVFCDKSSEQPSTVLFRLIFNYLFNHIQGNKNAYEMFMNEWSETCFQILSIHHQHIRADFFNLLSMISYYGCVEKTDSNRRDMLLNLFTKHFNHKSYMSYINMVSRDELGSTGLQQWSLKFVDFYFPEFYFKVVLSNPSLVVDYDVESRINLVGYLLESLASLFKTNGLELLGDSNLRLLMELFVQSYLDFSTDQLQQARLNLLKLLANCLSDILTMPVDYNINEDVVRSGIVYVQTDEQFFTAVCHLFKLIHSDNDLIAFLSLEKNKSVRSNLKCDLLRLIGILVFENNCNQNKLVENELLTIISSSFSIDTENLFLREWSILALKHILSCLDSK